MSTPSSLVFNAVVKLFCDNWPSWTLYSVFLVLIKILLSETTVSTLFSLAPDTLDPAPDISNVSPLAITFEEPESPSIVNW